MKSNAGEVKCKFEGTGHFLSTTPKCTGAGKSKTSEVRFSSRA